jgi:S-DNA-T family DNA segregation ATPase FtsK/SpoIIIE
MSTARRRHRIDLSFGPGHGPVSGVLNAAAAMYALTMWLHVGDGSAWWGLTAGVTMASAGVIVARAYDQPASVQIFRAGCWSAAGAWSGWTLSGFQGIPLPFTDFRLLTMCSSPGHPWAWKPFYGMLVGCAVAAMVGWRMTVEARKAEAEAARKAAEAAADAEAAEAARLAARVPVHEEEAIAFQWQPVLDRISRKKMGRIVGVERWVPYYGFTLDVTLPDDGTVLRDVKTYEEALASAADLPDGCGVEITGNPGMGRRNILVKVTIGTALAEDIPAPPPAMDSIENPQVIGVAGDGKPVGIDQRYNCVTLVGQTDSGKSNQLNAIIKANASCSDVLLVGIDLSGQGRVLRPWIRAYHEGRAPRPAFAQVAHTAHRARLLCASLVNIIDGRTADYAELMFREGTDKIMVRPEIPQIMVVVDEFGKLPDDVKEMLGTIADTGRGAGVRGVFCALEATASYIPGNIITQSRVRMAMRVSDEAQLQYLFDSTWSRGRFDPASMPWKGSGLVAVGPTTPAKFKGYRVDPKTIDAISIAVADWRPELDPASLRRADTVTLNVLTDMGREKATFTNVWTNAEAETYPDIFPASVATQAISGGASAQGGGTATLEKEGKTMNSDPGTAADAARDMNRAVGGMMDALENLEREADQAERDHNAGKSTTTGGGDQGAGEPGDGDPASMSAAELNALFALPAADRTSPPAAVTGPAGPVTHDNPQNKPHPRRRTLQIVIEHAGKGGILPGAVTDQLAKEGYSTDRATVSGWLKRFRASGKVVQPEGERTPYLPGPDIGDPYTL